LKGERFYVAYEDQINWREIVIGWNLDHEPCEENECGYSIKSGPFATREEAQKNMEEN